MKNKLNNNHRLRNDKERVIRLSSCEIILMDDKLNARWRTRDFRGKIGVNFIGLSDDIETDNDCSQRR